MLFGNEIFGGYQIGAILPQLALLVSIQVSINCVRGLLGTST
jgi:hypothetical protein